MFGKIVRRETLFCGELENWDRITHSRRPLCIPSKFGERRVQFKKREPQERVPWAPMARTQNKILRQERFARKAAWNLGKDVYKLKKKAQDTFYSLAEAWVMSAPSSKKPDEGQFVIGSEVSMHMSSMKDLSSGSRTSMTVVTDKGGSPE